MTSATRVLVVSPALLEPATDRGGGIEVVDFQIACRLSRVWNVRVIGPYHGAYRRTVDTGQNLALEYIHYPAMKRYPPSTFLEEAILALVCLPTYSIPLLIRLVTLFRKGANAVIVHNGFPGLMGSLIAKVFDVRIVYSEGNSSPWMSPYLEDHLRPLRHRVGHVLGLVLGIVIGRLSDCIIAQNDGIRDNMIRRGLNNKRITVIPCGVDTQAFSPKRPGGVKKRYFKVGFLGRLTPEKEAPLLASIVSSAKERFPDVRFSIFGDGPSRSLLEDQPNIDHLGYVGHESLPEKLAELDIILYLQKDFGLALLECMSTGVPVIASNAGNTRSVVDHLKNGMTVTPTKEHFLDAIDTLKHDPILLKAMSDGARRSAEKAYDWAPVAKRWETVISDCIESRGAQSKNVNSP